MSAEYEMEELADMAVSQLRESIITESQLVEEEHEFLSKLLEWDYVILHLSERIPEEMKDLHKLNGNISDKLLEIRKLVESGELEHLHIEKEEEQILRQLKKDVEHRDWRAVKKDINKETKEVKRVRKLDKKELKKLHSKFIDLMRLMKKDNLISAIEEDLTVPKEREKYEKLEEYYFLQIYKFIRAYERIFRHLWRKESMLARKLT